MNTDKSQVALRFAQAGKSYTQHAVIQKKIAQQLFDLIREYYPKIRPNQVFEIGCGSGNLTHLLMQNLQIKHLFLNDLYADVQHHFQADQNLQWLIGDIEQQDFPQHLDLIVSSSALQWIHDLDVIFQKSHTSLNTDGYLCFSTFGQQNLQEIKALTGQGLTYLSIENLQEKLSNNGFEILYITEQTDQNLQWLIGDIEQQDFPQHLDLIVSSSALQWIHDLDVIFQKSHTSLNAEGYLCFSTFGQQNLQEIKALTGQGLTYLSIENLQEKLGNNGFEILYITEQTDHLPFQHPKDILQHLKATGVTATASNFRWTKQTLQDFYMNYQNFMNENELGEKTYTLTYHPIYCIARRLP